MDEPSVPLTPRVRLTEAEQAVLRELAQRDAAAVAPKVAASYTRLLELSRSSNPVDAVLVAHLAREILSALPGALGIELAHERLEYENRLQELCVVWPADARNGEPPAQALADLRRLLDDHERASGRAREGPLALLMQADRARTGFIPDPSIDRWTQLSARGSRLAHRIRNRERQFPAPDETRRLVDEMTALLLAAGAPYFEGIREVDRLLALEDPTDTDARSLAALLATQSQYAYFFERARETWLHPLARIRGLLTTPPRLVDVGGGYVQAPGWPQGAFLERAAGADPQFVADLARRSLPTNNPRAIAMVVQVARALPPDFAAGLAPALSRAMRTPLAVEYAAVETASLIRVLGQAGFQAEGADLLAAVVRASIASPRDDTWQMEQVLGEPLEIVAAAGGEVVPHLRSCLRKLARASGGLRRHSALWLRNIDVRPGHGVDAVWLLANGLYRALLVAPLDGARLLEGELLADREPVLARIALAAMVERPDLIAAGDELLLDPLRWDDGRTTRHEFRRALAALWSRSSPAARDALLAYADRADEADVIIRRWAAEGIERDPDETRREWRSWLLYKVRDDLPPEWLQSCGPLRAIDDDRLPEPTADWVGPTSPFTEEDLSVLEPAAVLERARTWQPTQPPTFDSPTAEGLGRTMASLVVRRLPEFVGLGAEFARLPAALLAQVTSAIERELREGHLDHREDAVELNLAVGTAFLAGGDTDSWSREIKRDVAGTVTFAADENLLSETQADMALHLVSALLLDPDPSPASESQDIANGYDAGMLALNAVRGQATTAAIELLLSARRANRATQAEETSEILRNAISRDTSLSVRSAVGMRLPWLLGRDAAHQAEWLELLFGADVPSPSSGATWSAYLLYARFFPDIATVLAPQYQSAVTTLVPRSEEDRGRPRDDDERLGVHVAMAHILGLPPESEGAWLQEFYGRAADWVRARVTRWIAEQAADAEVAGEIRGRARAFLANRVQLVDAQAGDGELKAISWISATADSERDILETILLPALEKTGGATENEQGATSLASRIASEMPREAARLLQLLVAGDQWHSLPHIAATELRAALEQIMQSADREARATAADVINTLGAQGFLEFRDLLA